MSQRTVTTLLGNRQRLDGGAMFGNAPRALWTRWAEPDDANRIELACRCLLVRESGRTLLFEAGIGAFFEPRLAQRFGVEPREHLLLAALAEHGLGHEDIDVVVLSHLHFDHAGGLLSAWSEDEAPRLLFPRATFVTGARHWQRAQDPHPRDRASFLPELNAQLHASGRLHLAEGPRDAVLGDGYRLHWSDGHTPGLMLTEIELASGPLLFAGDLVPGAAWVHLPITMGYDRFPELLIDEKRALLGELLDRGGRLAFTHDPRWAVAALQRDERGRFSVQEARGEVIDLG